MDSDAFCIWYQPPRLSSLVTRIAGLQCGRTRTADVPRVPYRNQRYHAVRLGKLFGRHKILPKVSPNKTWEGFLGGVVSTTVIGYFLGFLTPLSTPNVILVSALIAIAGFAGDVVISAIKRDKGIKDMGDSIPGHGGVFDRIDSLSYTAPVFFHLVYYIAY